MKLVLEGTQAYRRHRGWGRYNELLLMGLHQRASESMESAVFYHDDRSRVPLAKTFPPSSGFRIHPIETSLDRYTEIEEDFGNSYIDRVYQCYDLYHSVTEFPFYSTKVPLVCTIHELTPLLFKAKFPQSFVAEFFRYVSYAVQNSARLICPSSRTKTDLLEHFKVDADRVAVIPNGLRPEFKADDSIKITKSYFLYVGGVGKPSKNISSFLRAFQQCLVRTDQACELIVVTAEYNRHSFAQKFGLSDFTQTHITLESDVSDERLIRLYQNATALVYPSYYEGFALPVIEALACGCPVLCDENLPAVNEWPVNQVIGTDVNDVEVMTESLLDAIRYQTRYKRQSMANADNVQKFFCLDSFSDAHIELYRSI